MYFILIIINIIIRYYAIVFIKIFIYMIKKIFFNKVEKLKEKLMKNFKTIHGPQKTKYATTVYILNRIKSKKKVYKCKEKV